jgi:hypothetical protein
LQSSIEIKKIKLQKGKKETEEEEEKKNPSASHAGRSRCGWFVGLITIRHPSLFLFHCNTTRLEFCLKMKK